MLDVITFFIFINIYSLLLSLFLKNPASNPTWNMAEIRRQGCIKIIN